MTTPNNNYDLINMRRARVAQLKLRGLASREIALALAQGDAHGNGRIVNQSTGRPFDHATILNDLKVLQEEWRRDRIQDTDTHADRQLAEINEIKRAAWATSNPKLALEAIDREMRLLGTSKATEFHFNFDVNVVMQLVQVLEGRGENVTQFFMELMQEFMEADSQEVQEAEDIINGTYIRPD